MKEILKDICKKSLEKAYEQNLKSIFTSFFYDYKTKDVDYIPQCNPDLYMKDVVVEVLESFVSHDFTVSKMTCSFWDIEEVAKNPTMGNFDAEILLYNILCHIFITVIITIIHFKSPSIRLCYNKYNH